MGTVLRSAKDSAWRWEQERPTTTLKIKKPALERNPIPSTPPRGFQGIPPGYFPAPMANPKTSSSGSLLRPVQLSRPTFKEAQTPPNTGPIGRTEVRKDVLETTRHQLLQALEIDPGNAKAHAMLLVTHYRLGRLDAVMQTLRQARHRGILPSELKAVSRCNQMVKEEMVSCRLPLDLHGEFMEYLGL
jgi:hypothetical protein